MKVVQPVATEQNLVVRARENATSVTLVLVDTLVQTYTYTGITTSYSNGLLTVPFTQDINEGDTFKAVIKNGSGDVIWRGKLYATAQIPKTFSYN